MTKLLLKINCATCTCIITAINMQSLQTQGEATPSSYRTVLYDDGVAENISTPLAETQGGQGGLRPPHLSKWGGQAPPVCNEFVGVV